MTLFLASVRNAAEASIALAAGADIVDLKDPAKGALGAVDAAATKAILATLGGRVATSATIGDLPMQPEGLRDAVLARAASGVDYVKVGLDGGGDAESCLDALGETTRCVRLIVVLFADRLPAFDAPERAAAIGAAGIMLDTAEKGRGTLLSHLSRPELARFVARGRIFGLGAGLAGSLHAAEVPSLLALAPDVLGFRGALCRGVRTDRIDPESARAIRALIPAANHTLGNRPREALNSGAAQALC